MNKAIATVLAVILLVGLGTGLGQFPYRDTLRAEENAAQQTDKDTIVGTWRITSARFDGKDLPGEFTTLTRFVFSKQGKLIMRIAGEEKDGKYQLLDEGKVDMSMGQPAPLPGLYKFEGKDRLTLCFGKSPKAERPTKISGEQGTGQVLFVLQRAKPGEEKLTAEELAKHREAIDKVREAAGRAQHQNNLKQIGLAMHNHHDQYGQLPLHAIYSKDGKTPLLSWRVAILPYLEEKALYDEFKLDESWDSAHNQKLIAKMPKVYEVPSLAQKKQSGRTHYQVITGPNTLFDGPKKMRFVDITDGTSNTILVIEGKEPVVWTQPMDLTMPKGKDKIPAVGGLFKGGISVLFCDGSVRLFRLNPPVVEFRAAVTPHGGEVYDQEKLEP